MDINEYIKQNQITVDLWKNRFNCLFYWDIKYVYDDEHWSQTVYDVRQKQAIIYPCDIDTENDYIIHEIITLAFVASRNVEQQRELISDLVGIVVKD